MLSTFLKGFIRLPRTTNSALVSSHLLDLSYGRYFATKTTKSVGKKAVKKAGSKKAGAKTAKKVVAKPKKPQKPKRVPSAFNLYVKDQFHKYRKGDEKAPQTMKTLALAWKRLADLEKRPFQQQASKLKLQKEEMMKQKKANQGPLSAYPQFVKDNFSNVRSQNPQQKAPEVMSRLASMWSRLPQAEKDTRKQNADYARQQFLKKKATA